MVLLKEAPAPARKGKTMFAQLVSTIDSFLWGWPLIILLFGTHNLSRKTSLKQLRCLSQRMKAPREMSPSSAL